MPKTTSLSAFRIKMEAVQTVQASESETKLTTEAIPTSQAAYAKKKEPEFLNFEGAQESIPRNQFRRPM